VKTQISQATTTNQYTPQNQKPTYHEENIAFMNIPIWIKEVLPEVGKVKQKLVQIGCAEEVKKTCTP
jgi:hypothetical protein